MIILWLAKLTHSFNRSFLSYAFEQPWYLQGYFLVEEEGAEGGGGGAALVEGWGAVDGDGAEGSSLSNAWIKSLNFFWARVSNSAILANLF